MSEQSVIKALLDIAYEYSSPAAIAGTGIATLLHFDPAQAAAVLGVLALVLKAFSNATDSVPAVTPPTA